MRWSATLWIEEGHYESSCFGNLVIYFFDTSICRWRRSPGSRWYLCGNEDAFVIFEETRTKKLFNSLVLQPHVARTENFQHDPRLSSIMRAAKAVRCHVMLVPDDVIPKMNSSPVRNWPLQIISN